MSRISNLSNLRIPHFNSWKTTWYENNKNYSSLFFRDFQLFQYLKGLFYRLKMLTDDFYFSNLINHCFFIKVNIYLYKFQIKKFFLSFFTDQYLLYNFILRKKRIKTSVLSFLNIPFFFSILTSLHSNTILFNICSFFFSYINTYNFLSHRNRKKFIFSISSLRKIKKKNNELAHPLKKKLKKNLIYFFNFFNRKKVNFFFLKEYSFFFILKNILFFFFIFKIDYFFFSFFSFYNNKLLLLKTNILYFININKKKNELMSFYYLKENYRRELSRDVFDERTYYDYFFYFFLYSLILNIEKTIYLFSGNKCIFFPVFYYYKKFPSFLSAKLINDYVLLELEKGNNLYRVFKSLQFYQLKEKFKLKQELLVDFNKEIFFSFFNKYKLDLKNKLFFFKLLKRSNIKSISNLVRFNKKSLFNTYSIIHKLFDDLYYNEILSKKYPLIGLRIECNGPPKRGRQARLVAYHQIVKNYKLFGKMPNKSILADIDYYQSFARTKQGSIGIKVWVFFYSKTYDSNYKLISII